VTLDIILDSLVPIFFGMGLGYVGGWTRDIDNKHVGELNALVMDFALPAAIFGAVAQQSRAALLAQIPLAVNLSISMLLLYVVTYAMARKAFRASPTEASVQAITTSSPNFGAAGLPLVGALFGAHYLVAVAVALAVTGLVLSALPAGFFGILFGLRFGIASEVTGTTLVASTILSAVTLSAAIYLTDGMGP